MTRLVIRSLNISRGVQLKKHWLMKRLIITWLCSHLSFCLPLMLGPMATTANAMDRVRQETRVDAAISRFGVSGRGVIVALLDRGIDWRNNDFRNGDGTTRIQYIFDLTDDSGAMSAAAPIVTGIIALMLALDPRLDAAQVKAILQQSARQDQFTGPTPNPNWGYGKVDALAALERVNQLRSVALRRRSRVS